MTAGEEERFIELWHKLVGTHNGAGYELGEEGGVETEVEDVGGWQDFAVIGVDNVADVLKGEEADAYGQDDGVGDGIVGGGNGVEDVGEEIGVFKVAEYSEIDHHAENHEGFADAESGTAGLLFLADKGAEKHAERVAEDGGEDEEQNVIA